MNADGTLAPDIIDTQLPRGAKILHGDGVLYFSFMAEDANGEPNVAIGVTDGDAWFLDSFGTTPSDLNIWQLADGRALVTWTAATGGDGDGQTIMAQMTAFGVPIGEAFIIDSNGVGNQSAVSIASLTDGRFVASWQTQSTDGNGLDIASQMFNPRSYTGTGGDDFWVGGELNDTIGGGEGSDTLIGGDGDDSVDAGGGDDDVHDGAGHDLADGGDGNDYYFASGTWADYDFAEDGNGRLLLSWAGDPAYGTKTLTGFETIHFTDNVELAARLDALPVNAGPTALSDDNSADAIVEASLHNAGDDFATGNVLDNDTDPNSVLGDRLTVTSVRFGAGSSVAVDGDGTAIAGTYGILTLFADGDYGYVLNNDSAAVQALATGETRTEQFTYSVADARALSALANLTITIAGRDDTDNAAPVAQDDAFATTARYLAITPSQLTGNDSDADSDTLHVTGISNVVGGTVIWNPTFQLYYFSAASGFSGTAQFTYAITDGFETDSATVRIDVSPTPDPYSPYHPLPDPYGPLVPSPPIEFYPTPEPQQPIPLSPPIQFTPLPDYHSDFQWHVFGTEKPDRIDLTHSHKHKSSVFPDYIYGFGGNDTIKAAGGSDTVDGGSGNDLLYGESGNDTILGGSDNDKLYGGAGEDTLTGQSGMDTLSGGGSADKFVFTSSLRASNVDTVSDFKHDIDLLQLESRHFKRIGATLDPSEFYAKAGATKAHDKSDRIVYDTKSGKLYYDDDGKGGHAAVHFATLSGHPKLDGGDFEIV